MTLTVQALDHLVVQVSDEVSARWYGRVLGMTREDASPAAGQPPRTEMKFGRQKINLRPIAMSKGDWFTADHEAAGSEDLCFLTDSTPDDVVRQLQAQGVAIVAGPGPRRGAQGRLSQFIAAIRTALSSRSRPTTSKASQGFKSCGARFGAGFV